MSGDVKHRPIKPYADANDWVVVQSDDAGLGEEKRVKGGLIANFPTVADLPPASEFVGVAQAGGVSFASDGVAWHSVASEKISIPKLPDIAVKAIDALIYPPNPYAGIGGEQVTHPQMLYSAKNFGGYKYWLCYTPYPDGNSAYENPVILASNDRVNWVQPAINPLVEKPSGGYNSDTSIAFNADESVLYLIYRERMSTVNNLKLMHTNDGKNWAVPITIKSGVIASGQDYASPSLWFNPRLNLWEVVSHSLDSATDPKPVQKISSTDSDPYSVWGSPVTLAISPTAGKFFWHSQFLRDPSGAVFGVLSENTIGAGAKTGQVFLVYSGDFLNFTKVPLNLPLMAYRPSMYLDELGAARLLLSNNGFKYFADIALFEYKEYADYLADKAARLDGTKFALVRDTFNRADSAVTLGNTDNAMPWVVQLGTMGVSTNRAYNVTTANTKAVVATASSDCIAEMSIVTPAAAGTYLLIRGVDSNNYFRLGVANDTTKNITLQSIVAGLIVLNLNFPLYFDYSTPLKLGCKCTGDKLELIINDCIFAIVNDSTFLNGGNFGIQLIGTSGYIDNFLVTQIE